MDPTFNRSFKKVIIILMLLIIIIWDYKIMFIVMRIPNFKNEI